MIEGFEIIDAHCHPIARKLPCHVNHWGAPVTAEEFFAEERSFGVDRCCGSVLGEFPEGDFGNYRQCNQEALDFAQLENGYCYPGISVHPAFVKESVAEIEKAHKAGFRWVGELVYYKSHYSSYTTPEMMEIFAAARDLGMAVNLHPSKDEEIEFIMENLPDLTLIMAHPGETGGLAHRAELLKRYKNLHWDICGTGLFRWGMLKFLVNSCGAEKLLFGTDFPICSIPMQIYGVLGERIPEDAKKAIFSGNFRRITGIN